MNADEERLQVDLNSDSALEQTIRGHLWIESALIALIETTLLFPKHVDLARFSFVQKLELATAHGFVRPEDLPAYKRLNRIRNQLAHSLHAALSEQDMNDLINSLSPEIRKLYEQYHLDRVSETWQDRFGVAISLLYFRLETERGRYETHRAAVATTNREMHDSIREIREHLQSSQSAREMWLSFGGSDHFIDSKHGDEKNSSQ
ncbi:hypothetical protein [Rhodococcus globerulus]|uniref:hypothetical protein n=1 Tax=Rhodococcus globerulus TaxID=33008 RepID=UPI000A6DB419|nr:hypothetical protein [Rhodococcus globerulus]